MPPQTYNGRVFTPALDAEGRAGQSSTRDFIPGVPAKDLDADEHALFGLLISAAARGDTLYTVAGGPPEAPAPEAESGNGELPAHVVARQRREAGG